MALIEPFLLCCKFGLLSPESRTTLQGNEDIKYQEIYLITHRDCSQLETQVSGVSRIRHSELWLFDLQNGPSWLKTDLSSVLRKDRVLTAQHFSTVFVSKRDIQLDFTIGRMTTAENYYCICFGEFKTKEDLCNFKHSKALRASHVLGIN